MMNFIEKIGGRKFATALMLVFMATGFLFLEVGQIDFVKWADFVKWVFIGYAGTNAAGKIANTNKKQ